MGELGKTDSDIEKGTTHTQKVVDDGMNQLSPSIDGWGKAFTTGTTVCSMRKSHAQRRKKTGNEIRKGAVVVGGTQVSLLPDGGSRAPCVMRKSLLLRLEITAIPSASLRVFDTEGVKRF